jgi:hypothetical protein
MVVEIAPIKVIIYWLLKTSLIVNVGYLIEVGTLDPCTCYWNFCQYCKILRWPRCKTSLVWKGIFAFPIDSTFMCQDHETFIHDWPHNSLTPNIFLSWIWTNYLVEGIVVSLVHPIHT